VFKALGLRVVFRAPLRVQPYLWAWRGRIGGMRLGIAHHFGWAVAVTASADQQGPGLWRPVAHALPWTDDDDWIA
jgi:hypothetical protein